MPTQTSPVSRQTLLKAGDIHAALVQLLMHAETTTWTRFYTFLTGNSILVLSWVTIFVSPNEAAIVKSLVMIAICIVGILGSTAWHSLGIRGRAFVQEFLAKGTDFERSTIWQGGLSHYRPISIANGKMDDLQSIGIGSYKIQTIGPIVFVILYSFLLTISLARLFGVFLWFLVHVHR